MTLGDYCSATRKNGCLIITIPEDQMLDYFARSDPEFPAVVDREAFLQRLGEQILQAPAATSDDAYRTALEELLRRAASSAEAA